MKAVWRAFDHFWYRPAPASRLRMLRVLVGAYAVALLAIGFPNFVSVTRFQASEFAPVGPVALLAAPLPTVLVYALSALSIAFGVAFVTGYRYRIAGPVFALLFLWVTSYRNSWGMKFHTENLVALHLILLSAAPAAEKADPEPSASLPEGERPQQRPSGRYGWAITAMGAVTVVTYLLAGVAKLRLGGLHWMSGEALRVQVAYDNLRKIELGSVYSPVGAAVVGFTPLFRVLGVMTLLLELGAPVALLGGRFSRGWAIGAYSFHLGVVVLMAIAFPYPLTGVAYASFFRVERLAETKVGLWLGRNAERVAKRLSFAVRVAR
jgi:hypothetical protein